MLLLRLQGGESAGRSVGGFQNAYDKAILKLEEEAESIKEKESELQQRLMKKALAEGSLKERYTFHDLRGKTGSESEDERLLGHNDTRTLRRHYQRKPMRVTPLRPKILDN